MADKYLDWLETAQTQRSDLKEQLAEIGDFYQKRLWHQLTLALERDIRLPSFQKDSAFLPELYSRFIAGFAYRLNPLKVATIAEVVAKQYSESSEAGGLLLPPDLHLLLHSINRPSACQGADLQRWWTSRCISILALKNVLLAASNETSCLCFWWPSMPSLHRIQVMLQACCIP